MKTCQLHQTHDRIAKQAGPLMVSIWPPRVRKMTIWTMRLKVLLMLSAPNSLKLLHEKTGSYLNEAYSFSLSRQSDLGSQTPCIILVQLICLTAQRLCYSFICNRMLGSKVRQFFPLSLQSNKRSRAMLKKGRAKVTMANMKLLNFRIHTSQQSMESKQNMGRKYIVVGACCDPCFSPLTPPSYLLLP